jgi:predicted aldo/keto reductase-like oxidoreductase
MADKPLDRRTFLKLGIAAAAAGGLAAKATASRPVPGPGASSAGPAYDPKGLPTRTLGRTGIAVPILTLGAGSRYLTVEDPAKAEEILRHALDNGVFYWDSADNYVAGSIHSEERLSVVLKERRREVFLATKTHAKDHDGVLRAVEESLRRLGTDHIDLYQAHSIQTPAVVDEIGAPNGAWKALLKLREEKVARFLGFSGHASAPAMAAMARRFDFDCMLIALNHYQERQGDLERDAIGAAAERGLGVAVIKVIRPREKTDAVTPEELIRYAWGLPHVATAVIGMDSLDVLDKDIALAKAYRPLDAGRASGVRAVLDGVFARGDLPWMQAGYHDGILT